MTNTCGIKTTNSGTKYLGYGGQSLERFHKFLKQSYNELKKI